MACHCALITGCINVILQGHKEQDLGCGMTSFLFHFEKDGASTSLIKIAGRNRLFSLLGFEAQLIENLLPLRLEDDELYFNARPEYAQFL